MKHTTPQYSDSKALRCLYATQWTLWTRLEVNGVRTQGTPTHPKKEPKERGRRRILHQKIFSKNIAEFTQKIFSLKIVNLGLSPKRGISSQLKANHLAHSAKYMYIYKAFTEQN
jgi:hypothetical protein